MRKLHFPRFFRWLSLLALSLIALPAQARIHWISTNTFETANIRLARPNERWRVVEQASPALAKMVYLQNGRNAEITFAWHPPLDPQLSRLPKRGKRWEQGVRKLLAQDLDWSSDTLIDFSLQQNRVSLRLEGPAGLRVVSYRFADATLRGPSIKIELSQKSRSENTFLTELKSVEDSLVIIDTSP